MLRWGSHILKSTNSGAKAVLHTKTTKKASTDKSELTAKVKHSTLWLMKLRIWIFTTLCARNHRTVIMSIPKFSLWDDPKKLKDFTRSRNEYFSCVQSFPIWVLLAVLILGLLNQQLEISRMNPVRCLFMVRIMPMNVRAMSTEIFYFHLHPILLSMTLISALNREILCV